MLLTRDLYPEQMLKAATLSIGRFVWMFGRRRAFRQIPYGIAGWAAGLLGKSGVPKWAKNTLSP